MGFASDPLAQLKGSQRIAILILAFVIFLSVPLYQATRAPREGDPDVLRVGLMVYNRFAAQRFAGDLAMEAGIWWPHYTPAYLGFLGLLFGVFGDFETVMFLLVMIVHIVLLSGFFILGRSLALSFTPALLLALLSGLVVPSALGAHWSGVRLDMAAARNLYQALLPWLLTLALYLYRRRPQQPAVWPLFGLGMGLLVNLHPLTGTFMIALLGFVMLVGVITGRFNWRCLASFALATLPGVSLIYLSTYQVMANPPIPRPEAAAARVPTSIFFDLAKANLIFYRPPSWWLLIALYTFLLIITGSGLMRSWRNNSDPHRKKWWVAFGLVQFLGALMMQTIDWLVLLAAIEWARRTWRGREEPIDTLTIWLLTGMGILVLCVGGAVGLAGLSERDTFVLAQARALIRNIHLPYAVLIVSSAAALQHGLKSYDQKRLFLAAVSAALIVGFHYEARVPALEGTPYSADLFAVGQILPIDIWAYLGVALIIVWPVLDGPRRHIRIGWAAAIILQAISRLLSIPAGDASTLAAVTVIALASFVSLDRSVKVGTVAAALVILSLVPISGPSFFQRLVNETPRALTRNWSRIDNQSPYAASYRLGEWMRTHTPPNALVLTNDTYLRYWMQRPVFGGAADRDFFEYDAAAYGQISEAYAELPEVFSSAERLVSFARAIQAQYIVVRSPLDFSDVAATEVVYDADNYSVYHLNDG